MTATAGNRPKTAFVQGVGGTASTPLRSGHEWRRRTPSIDIVNFIVRVLIFFELAVITIVADLMLRHSPVCNAAVRAQWLCPITGRGVRSLMKQRSVASSHLNQTRFSPKNMEGEWFFAK